MTSLKDQFAPFAQRMQAAGLPDLAIHTFEHYFRQLVKGHTGLIPETAIEPVTTLPDAEALPAALWDDGRAALKQTVLIKLNGGLGTSMGLEAAKSLLVVKEGLTFLDIIARQALHSCVPLVLMNSYNTRDDSLRLLERYAGLQGEIPLDFLQHRVPKVQQEDLSPVCWPEEPQLEWCPPGHGDLYPAMVTSGILDRLLSAGYRYAFVSNADNLGAVLDEQILGYFVTQGLPFLMEVADRTTADSKGGHLARFPDGRLLLRESAQSRPEDAAAFQDIDRHRYFNTNNLWLNLEALRAILRANNNIVDLPMIRNAKTVDPREPESTPVYQLETAMGSAISLFDDAGALRVPRTRFAPVKTTEDLLAIRSDIFVLTEESRILPNPARKLGPLVLKLDPTYYRLIDDLEARFPYGPPSLLECERLTIQGDFRFGRAVSLKGSVQLVNTSDQPQAIADGAILGM